MTAQSERCGECGTCRHVAASAQDYASTPTDRRQLRELGAMFPCEQDARYQADQAAWRGQFR